MAAEGEEAIKLWLMCLETGDSMAHHALGYTYFGLRRYVEAYPHLRRYTEIAPGGSWNWCWFGKAAAAIGERGEAERALRHAIQLTAEGGEETAAAEVLAGLDSTARSTCRNVGSESRVGDAVDPKDESGRMTDQLDEALAYAVELHREQTRKGSGVPYIGHLLTVAGLVIEDGGSKAQAIAALLHDSAEDQGGEGRLAEIESRFGPDVARIVVACSDTLETPKPPWRKRKERYLTHLEDAPAEVILVSLADKVDNARAILRDLRAEGPSLWERFNVRDPDQHLWYYRSLLDVFKQRSDSWMVGELERVVTRIAHLIATPHGLAARRLEEVQIGVDRAQSWCDAQRREIESGKLTLRPGHPDDDWDYDYNEAMNLILDRTRETIEALEKEREAIGIAESRLQGK